MADLTLNHLTCEFRTSDNIVRAVDDLSLEARHGELIVLVGPSGCGKTTTLRLIAGLESPTAGTIRLGDRILNGIPSRDRDVAMVFQNIALYPHMTIFENLSFGLRMRGIPKPDLEREVRRAAGKLGLTTMLDRRPHQLSGGEKQRVALGRAIAGKPQLFLLDEPLSSLDVGLRSAGRSEIKRIQRELAVPMIYVTHDQEEAMTLADRIAVLKGGRLQQFGSPCEIYNRPANRFVASVFGWPPMNFLTGDVHRSGGRTVFRSGTIEVLLDSKLQIDPMSNVTLGIRPHEIRLAGTGTGIRGVIGAVELLGDAQILRVLMDGSVEVNLKMPATGTRAVNEPVELEFPGECLHFFTVDGTRLN